MESASGSFCVPPWIIRRRERKRWVRGRETRKGKKKAITRKGNDEETSFLIGSSSFSVVNPR